MGNCCKGEEGAEVILNEQAKKPTTRAGRPDIEYQRGQDEIIDQILDDREVGGKKGEEKIEYIEKI